MSQIIGGVDYSQYANWERIVGENGQVGYKVPNTNYIYDPFLSSQKGRPVLFQNVQNEIEKRKRDEARAREAASPGRQILNTVAPIGAVIGGQQLVQGLAKPTLVSVQNGVQYFSDGSQILANGTKVPPTIASPTVANPGTLPVATEVSQALPVPGDPNFVGPVAPDGVAATETAKAAQTGFFSTPMESLGGYTPGQALGAAAAAKGTYDAVKDMQHGGSGRAGLTQAGAGLGSFAGPIGTVAGAAIGNIMGYGLQGHGIKNHLALMATSPMLATARFLGFDPVHKTTRQVAQEHTQELLNQGKDDQQWQNYTQGMRAQYNAAPTDKEHPFAGKYKTWEEYKSAGLLAEDLTGVYGNLKTYGPEWAKLTFDQQKAVTQKNIDDGLYDSNKGEVELLDEAKAKRNLDSVLGRKPAPETKEDEIGKKLAARQNARRVMRF